ncbi:MAG: helix-turn-helix transcriptional regulator [Pseudomonadota bacterium]
MTKKMVSNLPSVQRLLSELGANIRLARLRRRFSASLVAERAGISRPTLRSIERGESSVTLGAYARVLLCLGLEKDLSSIARDDALGRKIQDAQLPLRARAPRHREEHK